MLMYAVNYSSYKERKLELAKIKMAGQTCKKNWKSESENCNQCISSLTQFNYSVCLCLSK